MKLCIKKEWKQKQSSDNLGIQKLKKTYQIFVQFLAQVGANFHSSNEDKKQS